MKFIHLALLCALLVTGSRLSAQEVSVGADLETYFDNKENSGTEFAMPHVASETGTDFAVRFAPRVAVKWDEKNTMVFAVDLLQNFGEKNLSFFSEVRPVVYYQFQTEKVKAAAGIFTREMTHSEDYSTAFFSETYRFFNNRMGGVMAQYNAGASYVEFICDWEGMYSTRSREKFRILSGGRHYLDTFYYGYNLSLFHFAAQQDSPNQNVVDQLLVNPRIGVRFNAYFDFDIYAGLLQTMQRDRTFEDKWRTPRMGELGFRISRWGVSLDERLYVGQNLNPFYAGHTLENEDGTTTVIPYGTELYPGESFFRTDRNVYNRAAISYAKSFFNDTLHIKAAFVTHYDGTGLGMQQQLAVSVHFLKCVYNSKNHKK